MNLVPIGGFNDYFPTNKSDMKYLKKYIYGDFGPKINKCGIRFMDEFQEKNGLKLPKDLYTLFTWKHIDKYIYEVHSSNNYLRLPDHPVRITNKDISKHIWALASGQDLQLPHKYMLRIMNEGQSQYFVYAGWDSDQDQESLIYLSSTGLHEFTDPKDGFYLKEKKTLDKISTSLSKFLLSYIYTGKVYNLHKNKSIDFYVNRIKDMIINNDNN